MRKFVTMIIIASMVWLISYAGIASADGGKNRLGSDLIEEVFQAGCIDRAGELLPDTVITASTCEEEDPGSCVVVIVDCEKFLSK